MRRDDVFGQARFIHRKTVVLARDHHLPGLQVLNRVIGAVMPELHLLGFRTCRQRE